LAIQFASTNLKQAAALLYAHIIIIIIIIIINLFATNQNIHNNHRVYMMAGRQKN